MSGPFGLALGRAGTVLRRWLIEPDYPLLAVEVRPRALAVARLERQGNGLRLAAAAAADLPEGLIDVSVNRPNLKDKEALRAALGSLLERAGGLRAGPVALVLPDPVARVTVLPAAELAANRNTSSLEMARFRLRKTVPFEVKDAQISLASPPRGASGTVVAAVFRPVLADYEEVLQGLGLLPGVVEVSTLCLLSLLPGGDGDRLLVNWDEGYASLVLLRDGWPILVRTLAEAAAEPAGLRREVANTLLYYRERLQGPGLLGATLRSGHLPAMEAAALLHEPLGQPPALLDPWEGLLAGDAAEGQALAGALACVRRATTSRAA